MPTLRLTRSGQTVEAAFEDDGQPRQSVVRQFSFSLSAQDAEDLRWYLEDYIVYPLDPAPKFAARIKGHIREIGHELFRSVLGGTDVWAAAKSRLGDTRIEVESGAGDGMVPWELLRDPDSEIPLALHVPSFVRAHSQAALRPKPAPQEAGKIRILLVICRPGGDKDVPFRSVARHLIRGLSAEARENFELAVLRPPTFEQLGKRLRAAKANDKPFHVVHFDGHGSSGAVWFENPDVEGNAQPVPAADLGRLLKETQVPVLILNACRSAHAEPPQQPQAASNIHEQIRTFGSLAQAVMDYGVSGVVAWRYNVFVRTAAQFMAELYGALVSGVSLGEAATLARKQLQSAKGPIEDWIVPVVFEAAPVRLFPKARVPLEIKLEATATPDSGLPQAPDIGFIGRDETILHLDRIFDSQPIVLLHAYAGSGKTSTAAEFARWYLQTGGLDGPVLFTSFEHPKKLPQVLDQLARAFEPVLEQSKIQWLTLDPAQRRDVALQVLKQIPVLWIWDNVEPIAGFPKGTTSQWTNPEQEELADFLRAARATKAKFLLTSRRDEQDWLHGLPARIPLPRMPFEERVQMAGEIAAKLGRRMEDVEDWRPLLQFTQGNPLTLTVLVGQALRDGLRTKSEIEAFVQKLRTGEADFEDEAGEGRTRSLAASLAYGFENAFTEAERKQLALLHLFQGFVDVDALRAMGRDGSEWCLPEVKGLTREAGIALLDRATEVGLLTDMGGGYYTIHPALPWFFRRWFEQYYAETRRAKTGAFVEAIRNLGNYYVAQHQSGDTQVIDALAEEEANLLHARRLARAEGWLEQLIGPMQGLNLLYGHTGRQVEWAHLVEEIIPDFSDPVTEGPLPGREEEWDILTFYRVSLASHARRVDEAERLQRLRVEWHRHCSKATIERPSDTWSTVERNVIRSLGSALQDLSHIQRANGVTSCVDGYKEALALLETIKDLRGAAVSSFNLGLSYEQVSEIRDLSAAEHWYRRSLQLCPKGDQMGQAMCLGQLGSIADERFLDARESGCTFEESAGYLAEAVRLYEEVLRMLPPDAVVHLAVTHNQLGLVYGRAGQVDLALNHYRESVRYKERQGDRFAAGRTRFNVALMLAQGSRGEEAREWALAAMRDFEACGNADKEVVETLQLLQAIESGLPNPGPQS